MADVTENRTYGKIAGFWVLTQKPGAGPMSSKMKTNFKKSAKSIKFLKNLMKKGQ
jgi:hypothetical protein